MRSGLYIPLFDELTDRALVARLCAEAEEAGWQPDGDPPRPAPAGQGGARDRDP